MHIRNLSILAYANGFTLWHYKSGDDSLQAVAAGGYFQTAADMLAPGDMVMASGNAGAQILVVGPRAKDGPHLDGQPEPVVTTARMC